MARVTLTVLLWVSAVLLVLGVTGAQDAPFRATDPGVRGGAPGAGGPIGGLTLREGEFFVAGKEDFEEAEEVDEGLGPRMNLDGCAGCHSQPAVGGTSGFVNPQVAFA